MSDSTPLQLRFPVFADLTVRADFEGGNLSTDLGALLLGAVDRHTGLINRLATAITDPRHPSYITHPLRDLLTQRIFQIASGYEDVNDADTLRRDPLFKLAAGRKPEAPHDLASSATFSRLENRLSRTALYRLARALVHQFLASYAVPPASIILDLDHTDDATHGQQELALYNHHYGGYRYLPLLIFEARSGALVSAILRPGKRPTGAENAMILQRVLAEIRRHWPQTHILVRGDGHFATPALMDLIDAAPHTDFLFGLPGNRVLHRRAEGLLRNARGHFHLHRQLAQAGLGPAVEAVRHFGEFAYAAGSWSRPQRVLVKAEVMALGDNPRFVVTSLTGSSPGVLYQDDYCARGAAELLIKQLKGDLAADRTSASTFLANQARLLWHAAAYVLHQQLRTRFLAGTELAHAQPKTVILKLFKIAARVKQYKDRVLLHLPDSCPVRALLGLLTERLRAPLHLAPLAASP